MPADIHCTLADRDAEQFVDVFYSVQTNDDQTDFLLDRASAIHEAVPKAIMERAQLTRCRRT